MLDFAALPPEINSTRMYTGPGSGPLMAAASGWDALAAQLELFAVGYSSALTSLQGQHWSGPAAAAMTGAATPYVAWANTTAMQAEQSAVQARTAAAAYEAAHAATVPPAAVAANRLQLMVLVATNFFGQNAPAIAANEAAYAEMWAQDATAMHGYAAASAPAAELAPFHQAPETTNAGGQAAQNAAASHATGTSTAENTQSALSHALSSMPHQPHSMSTSTTPQGGKSSPTLLQWLAPQELLPGGEYTAYDTLNITTHAPNELGVQTGHTVGDLGQFITNGIAKFNTDVLKTGSSTPKPALPGEGLGAGAGVRGATLAGMGNSTPMGKLSVPRSWTAATQAASHESSSQLSSASSRAAAAELANAPKPMSGQHGTPMMPMQGKSQGQAGGTPLTRMRDRRFRMPRPPAAG